MWQIECELASQRVTFPVSLLFLPGVRTGRHWNLSGSRPAVFVSAGWISDWLPAQVHTTQHRHSTPAIAPGFGPRRDQRRRKMDLAASVSD